MPSTHCAGLALQVNPCTGDEKQVHALIKAAIAPLRQLRPPPANYGMPHQNVAGVTHSGSVDVYSPLSG